MRIGLLSAWASRLGGGVFEAVVAHAAMLRRLGHEPLVFALEDAHSADDRARFAGCEVVAAPVSGPRQIGYAPALLPALRAARLDLLHLHGIWMYPSLAGARWAEASGRPYVISPHGMLDPWITSRGRAKKKVARIGYERRSWRAAHAFHALTGAEAADIARETGRSDAIEIVANPVPPAVAPALPAPDRPFVLALGRVHPKKNLIALIDAWARSAAPGAGWELVIAGWGEAADVAALEARLAAGDAPGVRFVGPAYGEVKASLLAHARFFALPSFSEGLPMAVLEAWAAGTPSIMTEGCNLPEGFAGGAALRTGTDPSEIAATLDAAVAMPALAHAAMADAARALAAGRFSLDAIATRWDAIYRRLGEARAAA